MQDHPSDGGFQGKIAIVTGAASGIGYSCTRKLLEKGCVVAGIDKNKKVSKLFNDLENYIGITCDLTRHAEIKKAIKTIVKKYGGIDI